MAQDNHSTDPDATLPLPKGLYSGMIVNGRYLIEKELGHGGMGVVYLASDQKLPRSVALKFLHVDLSTSPEQVARFEREAKAISALNHPHLAVIHDFDQVDGQRFLVLEYLSGGTLRSKISDLYSRGEQLSLERIVLYAIQIGSGLAHAHRRGIIHRDIKNANVMLTEEGTLKITDFGLAELGGDRGVHITQPGHILGTIAYMSPEQAQGLKLDHRTDIFSYGILLYELVTGKLPFNAYHQMALLNEIVNSPTPSLRQLRADAPEALELIVNKALEKLPENRYQQMEQLLLDLDDVRKQVEFETLPPPSGAGVPGPSTTPGSLSPKLEIAHVLFMDLVGYSLLPMDRQTALIRELQERVRNTSEFRRAQANNQLLSLPSGDGMALVFFDDPEAPVRCATELSRALYGSADMRLRMGVNSGLVYRIDDINANKGVAGGGINYAQRVMDCGDAGHILLSRRVADDLAQLERWSESLHDLGEHQVKHGAKIHLFNLYSDEFGNPERPAKSPPPERDQNEPKPKPSMLRWIVVTVALLILAVVGWQYKERFVPAVSSIPKTTPTPLLTQTPTIPDLELRLSLMVKHDGQPSQEPTLVSSEYDFDPTCRIRLRFVTLREKGYLYMINEGPERQNGYPRYNAMYPTKNASALLPAQQQLEYPESSWFHFDKEKGIEKIWIVWSASMVPELEMAKDFLNPDDRGTINKPSVIQQIQEILIQHSEPKPMVVDDPNNREKTISGKGNILVYPLKLKHH